MKKHKIESQEKIDEIINKAQVCTVSMVDGEEPYAIPMNFGYENGYIILHSAPIGKKFDVLKNNNRVCISFFTDEAMNIRHEQVACSYSMKFKSVLAFGKAIEIEGIQEKTDGMNAVMKHYAGKSFKFNEPAIKGVRLMKVKVENFTAFIRGYNE